MDNIQLGKHKTTRRRNEMLLKKITINILTILAIIIACPSVWAATYYVDSSSGSDSNSGTTESQAWKSISKVNNFAFKAGDDILFKTGQSWDEILKPVSGSSESATVTYGSYGSAAKPVIRSFDVNNKAYVEARDISFRNSSYNHPVVIQNNSHHITIRDCDIIADSSNSTWAALYILMNSHHNKIIGCNIEHRNYDRQSDAVNLRRNANYNLIENCTIGNATHYSLSLEGANAEYPDYTCSHNVIRNNTIKNDVGAPSGLQSNSHRNLFEGNTIIGGGPQDKQPRSLKDVSMDNIIRNNVFRDNPMSSTGSGLAMEVYKYNSDPANIAKGNRIYNNVITNISRYPIVIATNGDSGAYVEDNVFKNNVIYNNNPSNGYSVTVQAHTAIRDNYFHNNLVYESGKTKVLYVNSGAYSVPEIEDGNFWKGNKQSDPMLDTNYNPKQSSPCIDNGDYLTFVTSSSGSGTTFQVSDSNYFSDGFGIVPGDVIVVGNTTATITAIDHTKNIISVSKQISWQYGQPVNLPYSGNKPDIGKLDGDGESSAAIQAPQNLRIQ
jgi:hypothetical protein